MPLLMSSEAPFKITGHTQLWLALTSPLCLLCTKQMVSWKSSVDLQNLCDFKVFPNFFSHGPAARQIVHQFPVAFGRPKYLLPWKQFEFIDFEICDYFLKFFSPSKFTLEKNSHNRTHWPIFCAKTFREISYMINIVWLIWCKKSILSIFTLESMTILCELLK